MPLQFSQARQKLYQLAREEKPRLAEAALWIAQEEYSDLNPQACLTQLDQMAQDIREILPDPPYLLKVIKSINKYLFEHLEFAGNEAEYYDPRNSYLNQVLIRRKGIPITLSLIYLDITEQLNFPMEGVNFPGHFLIRPLDENSEFYVDPFNGGEILFAEDCQEKLNQLVGRPMQLTPSLVKTITPQSFLVRMLNNLKHIYLTKQDVNRSLAACERILLVDPEQTEELRDRGLLYYQLGRWQEARQDLEDFLDLHSNSPDIQVLEQILKNIESGEGPDNTD